MMFALILTLRHSFEERVTFISDDFNEVKKMVKASCEARLVYLRVWIRRVPMSLEQAREWWNCCGHQHAVKNLPPPALFLPKTFQDDYWRGYNNALEDKCQGK
jgi:hypothetical protein